MLYFILCAYGLTQILCYGTILEKIRPNKGILGELFQCSMCVGFWVGMFLLVISPYTELFTFEVNIVNAFLLGCLSSGSSYVLDKVVGDEGIKYEKKNTNTNS